MVITSAIDRLKSYKEIANDSELTHLLLDLSGCPYLSLEQRTNLLSLIYEGVNIPKSVEELRANAQSIAGVYWFVNWANLNIKQLIERNELKFQY
ncbi:hypothetical protein [Shewanella algae]|uniref:hypothetical protein n=1 Tax=Shewanella algae TaxID=38313 RepID=UPI001C7FDCC1|nr:hypothetical protein [Shewanella algae]